MTSDKRFDAVVIGGGPAGSIAALQLNRLGWRTALVEKRSRNVGKACGHCLHRRGIHQLEELGLSDAVRVAQKGMLANLRVFAPSRFRHSGSQFSTSLMTGEDAGPPSVQVRRNLFDQALIDHAAQEGVAVLQPASAQVDRKRAGRVTLRTNGATRELECGLIVGADGVRSSVARVINGDLAGSGKYGFSFDVPRTEGEDSLGGGAIDMFITGRGYLGIVREVNGPLHVAALVQSRGTRDLFGFVRETGACFNRLRDAGFDRLDRDAVMDLRGTGPIPWVAPRVSAPGVVLIGDAAEFIEPFTGEGMCWAIENARLFADLAREQRIGTWNEPAAQHYQELYRTKVASKKRVCRAAAAVLEQPRMQRWLLRVSGSLPGMGVCRMRIVRNVVGR